jgi:hypothetical protein
MFWGWAAAAGPPPNHEQLSKLADIAFGVAFASLVAAGALAARTLRRR